MTSMLVEAVNKFLFCWHFAKNVIIFDEVFQIIGIFGSFWQNLSKNCQKVMTEELIDCLKVRLTSCSLKTNLASM